MTFAERRPGASVVRATRHPPFVTSPGARLIHRVRYVEVLFIPLVLAHSMRDPVTGDWLPPIHGDRWDGARFLAVYECGNKAAQPIWGASLNDPWLQPAAHAPDGFSVHVLPTRGPCTRCEAIVDRRTVRAMERASA